MADRLWITGRVAGGYGWEAGDGKPVGDGSLGVRWLLRPRIEVSGEVSYFRNPGYWSTEAGLALTFRF